MSENESPSKTPSERTPREPERSSGDQAAEAVRSVLEDQAQRKARQAEAARRSRKKRRLPLPAVALFWGAACLVVWVATPQFLLPEPLPEPSAENLEAGLRLEMVALIHEIDGYRGETGSVPQTLDPVTRFPPDGVRYAPLPPDFYRLTGDRGGTQVVYEAGDPLDALIADARATIRAGTGGNP